MVVCDICKSEDVFNTYEIPKYVPFWTGIKTPENQILSKESIDLCEHCAKSIANMLSDMVYEARANG